MIIIALLDAERICLYTIKYGYFYAPGLDKYCIIDASESRIYNSSIKLCDREDWTRIQILFDILFRFYSKRPGRKEPLV